MKDEKARLLRTGIVLCLAFLVGLGGTFLVLRSRVLAQAHQVLQQNIQDVAGDIKSLSDRAVLNYSRYLSENREVIRKYIAIREDYLQMVARDNLLSEVSILKENGVYEYSSNPALVGTQMDSLEWEPLLSLVSKTGEAVLSFQDVVAGDSCKKAAALLDDDEVLIIGVDKVQFTALAKKFGASLLTNRHLGRTGYLILAAPDGVIITSLQGARVGGSLSSSGFVPEADSLSPSRQEIYGVPSHVAKATVEGLTILGVLPQEEVSQALWSTFRTDALWEAAFFALLSIALWLSFLGKRNEPVAKAEVEASKEEPDHNA